MVAIDIAMRMRAARRRFPAALLIPVVVGNTTAYRSARLSRERNDSPLRMKINTYATVAVDADGVHVVRMPFGRWGRIAPQDVSFSGFGRAVVGRREMDTIVLRVRNPHSTFDLPVVPMRLRGNPVRALRQSELDEVGARVTAALR